MWPEVLHWNPPETYSPGPPLFLELCNQAHILVCWNKFIYHVTLLLLKFIWSFNQWRISGTAKKNRQRKINSHDIWYIIYSMVWYLHLMFSSLAMISIERDFSELVKLWIQWLTDFRATYEIWLSTFSKNNIYIYISACTYTHVYFYVFDIVNIQWRQNVLTPRTLATNLPRPCPPPPPLI